MSKSPNKYRNPVRDAEYEALEEEIRKTRNTERDAVVMKQPGFAVVEDENATPENKPNEEEGNWKKRYGDLQRHLEGLKREWSEKEVGYKAEIERLTAATKTPELPSSLSDEKIAEWEKKFPDVAAIIDFKARKRAQEIAGELGTKVSILEEDKKKLDLQRAYLQLLSIHEDYDDIRQSDEFKEWLSEQDEDFRSAIVAPKGYDEASVRRAARVVDFFKLETGWGSDAQKPKVKKKDTSAAETVPNKGASPDDFESEPKFTESQISKMNPAEFTRLKDKILAAQRKGPPYFVYDMTGAAR